MNRRKVEYVPLSGNTMHLLAELIKRDNDAYRIQPSAELAWGEANQLLKEPQSNVFIQMRDGRPSGYFRIKPGIGGNILEPVFVDREFRGKGLSRKMNKEALRISQMQRKSLTGYPAPVKRAQRAYDSLLEMQDADRARREKQRLGIGKFARKKR